LPLQRTRSELIRALENQRRFLETSAAAYDAGDETEAIRMATVAYVLLHDGGRRNKSILTQLGMRGSLRFVASGNGINPKNLFTQLPLVMVGAFSEGPRAEYLPLLGQGPMAPRNLQFGRWWEEIIYQSQKGRTLTRKSLIMSLRDQEGGGHFDEELSDEAYISAADKTTVGLFISINGTDRMPEKGPHLATMRQIAWEIERTLKPLVQQLLNEASSVQV
jgi:hypothetical protein